MAEEGLAAEGTVVEGTGAEGTGGVDTSTGDLGATSTEGTDGNAATEGNEEPLYSVKVNGKEEKVTLDKALKGYMREQDYTKKSQALAAERTQLAQVRALAEALERDPRQTLIALAGVLRVDLGGPPVGTTPAVDGDMDPLEILAREVRELTQTQQQDRQAALTAQQKAQNEQQIVAQIQQEVAELQETHGQFDGQTLIQWAVDNNSPNLSVAYRAWQYEQAEQARIDEQNRATAAKRNAQVVGGGRGAAAGSVVQGAAGSKPTVKEAYLMALAAHS